MKTLIILFVSLTCLSGVVSSNQLVQSDPAVIKPGNSHTLTCQGSGGFTFGGYYMNWIRQFPDGKLQWLCRIYSGGQYIAYHDDVKGRFTITRDDNNNKLTLKMDNMKPEDTSVYYCARSRYSSSLYFDIWGPGTPVTVTSATPKAPSLFPLISCGTSQEPNTIIGCLANNYLPNSINFSWADKVNNSFSNGFKKYNSVLRSEGTYATTTQIQVPTNTWVNGDIYYCTAKHSQGNKVASLQIPQGNSETKKPIVTVQAPINDDLQQNGNGTITCVVQGFFPETIEISWLKKFQTSLEAVTEKTVSDGNGGFRTTSFITVSKRDWDTDTVFSCVVKHTASDFHELRNISKSAVCESQAPGEIKVTAAPPSFETIYLQNIAPLTCIITGMENKDGLEVTWYANNEKLDTEIEDPIFSTSLRRYSAKATATVCPDDWKKKIFECRVSHPELPHLAVMPLSKPNGHDARAPTVLLFPPHPDELAKKETATLTCFIRGFYPHDVFVRWINSDNIEQSLVTTTAPMEEITSSSKKTHFLYSTLTLPNVEDWNSGKTYTCIVGHESLPLHTIQRTIDKSSGKPNHVNVSLVMSDTC